jgi:asparagine synthase (glutamine-hydrolysing)
LLDVVQRFDLETKLAEGLLTKTDRATMQSALELRTPYLDHDVVDYAATLPAHERVAGVRTKVFLKRYARRYLPDSIVYRRKRGLSVPLARWLRGPLLGWATDALSSDRLACVGIGRRTALGLLGEHASGKSEHGRALWALLALSEWIAWADRNGARWDIDAR